MQRIKGAPARILLMKWAGVSALPFHIVLNTVSKTRPFEYLRLTSLGVIGALVKTDEQEVG